MDKPEMALTTPYEDIKQTITRLEQGAIPADFEELNSRLDALVEAFEILARNHYDYPGVPESNLRSALSKARRR